MPNLTLADYRSLVLAYGNEDRDNADDNQKWRTADVDRAINIARLRMLRRVGVGVNRKRETVDAATGDITPPADLFNEAIVKYTPTGGTSRRLELRMARDMDLDNPSWRDAGRTGEPSLVVWDITDAGIVARLYPQPTATVTDGLTWEYTARLDDLADDADECPIMNLFPEFQDTLLQAGALFQLYMLEGGEGDDQIVKWKGVFEAECRELESMKSRIFAANRQNIGRG